MLRGRSGVVLSQLKSCLKCTVDAGNNCVRNYSTETAAAEKKQKYRVTADLDECVAKDLEDGLRHKKHPGKRALKSVELPAYLQRAARRVIDRHNSTQFKNDCHRMYQRVFHHQLPPEADELRNKRQEITQKVVANENLDFDILTDQERDHVIEKRDRTIDELVKRETYNWKDVDYNDYSATVYMASRLAPNYAALLSVFNEIKTDCNDFSPKTLFDFGSGIGTTMYAANEVWPGKINEHFNVDLNDEMNDISRLLLKGGDERQPLFYNNVFYRQFLPVRHTIKYDLVVSAFSLLELPSQRSRIQVLENLWYKTNDMLVIVEHGNRDGTGAILEARNFVLENNGYDVTKTYYSDLGAVELKPRRPEDAPQAYIVAPCPHHFSCPRLYTGGPVLCNFQIPYMPLDYGQRPTHINERYSYIVLRKGPKPEKDEPDWPRIVQPVLKKSEHLICRMCCPDGSIKSATFSKGKHKGHLYQCAKASQWGDLFPATVREIEKQPTRWDAKLERIKAWNAEHPKEPNDKNIG